MRYNLIPAVCAIVASTLLVGSLGAEDVKKPAIPKIGEKAPDVDLQPLAGKTVRLSQLTKKGPVVLVLLRGYPGYQCPICTQQVGSFRKHAKEFESVKATLLLVYPGEPKGLKERAEEFLKGSSLPEPFVFTIDPDYHFTAKYGLRWAAKAETAYPATFVIDHQGVVKFRKVSQSHGDRSKPEDVLAVIKGLQTADSAKSREIPQDRGNAPQINR
jgi:thioredoxin-dependent peroxiredoxin